MRPHRAITGVLCALALIFGLVAVASPAQAKKTGCPAWQCGGGGGTKPAPKPVKPTPNPGTGGGSGSETGTGGGLGELITFGYDAGIFWYDSDWYPGAPKNQLPPGATPVYYGKYQACGGKFTAYDGDWLGYSWQAVWLNRLNDAPGSGTGMGSTAPSVTYTCIRPPAYTERTIFCVEYFEGYQEGPYLNDLIVDGRIDLARQSTPFAKSQSARDCMRRTFGVDGVKSMDWGLWQLNMILSGKQCTLREYTEANAKTKQVPEPELRGCSPRTQNSSAVMAVWCPTSASDSGRQIWGNSSMKANPQPYIPNGVTFTANDCGTRIDPRPDQCLTGYPTQTTPNGVKIIHTGAPVEVMNQGFSRSGTHRFTWTPPKPRIWDPLKGGWAQENKSARETLSSFFDVPNSSSPRLAGKPLPSDYDKNQPFVGAPIQFGRYIPGPAAYYSINAAWRDATQRIGGTWQVTPTWRLRLAVKLPQFSPGTWDLTAGAPIVGSVGYVWQEVKLSCEADPATVVVKRTVVQP